MKVKLFGLFNHLLSNMLRQYDESHHQAFLNIVIYNSLKIIKIFKEKFKIKAVQKFKIKTD